MAATAGGRLDAAQSVADAILCGERAADLCRAEDTWSQVGRWSGVLAPPGWARADGPDAADATGLWWQQTECLLQAGGPATLQLRLRFLHKWLTQAEELAPDGTFRPVDGEAAKRWTRQSRDDDAALCGSDVTVAVGDLLAGERRVGIIAHPHQELEPLADGHGLLAGRLRRRRLPIHATLVMSATTCAGLTPVGRHGPGAPTPEPATPAPIHPPAAPNPEPATPALTHPPAAPSPEPATPAPTHGSEAPLLRLRWRVENAVQPLDPTARADQALAVSLLATHVLAAVEGGVFLSVVDPPEWARRAALACVNVRAFPVLMGAPGQRDLLLSSPVPLRDYPRPPVDRPSERLDAAEFGEINSLVPRAWADPAESGNSIHRARHVPTTS